MYVTSPFWCDVSKSWGPVVEMSKRGQVFQLALVGLLQSLDKASIVLNKAVDWLELLWCSELAVFFHLSRVPGVSWSRRENLFSVALCAQQHLR